MKRFTGRTAIASLFAGLSVLVFVLYGSSGSASASAPLGGPTGFSYDAAVGVAHGSIASAADPQAWVQKHVVRKTDSYLEARQCIPGWEQADIVFEFTTPGVDLAFVRSVNEAATSLDATTPGVNISVEWAS